MSTLKHSIPTLAADLRGMKGGGPITREVVTTAADMLETQAARIEALEAALRTAVAKFHEYERLHLAKYKGDGTDALDFVADCRRKSAENRRMAESLEAALAGNSGSVES